MINKHFKINTLITYGANAIVMGSGFILMFIINRFAGVQTYGELALIVSTAGIIASLLTARSGEAVTRFFVREKTHGNMQNAKLIVLIGLSIDFVLGFFVFLFFYLLSNLIASKFLERPELAFSVWVYGFITLSTFIRGSMIGYFQSHEYFRVLNFIQILEAVLKVGFLLIAFFILKHPNINYIIYSYIMASFFVTLFIIFIFSTRFFKEFQGIKIDQNTELIKEYFSFNMKTFLSTTLKAGNNNIDNLILGYFTDTKTVGVYQVLKNILAPISFVATPFGMMTVSKLTKFYSQRHYKEFKNLIKTISFKIVQIALVISIILYLVLPYILDILKIENDNYEIVFFMLIIYTLLIVSVWWSRIFATIVNPMMSVYGGVYILIHNLLITTLLTYLFDLKGLILSIIIAYSVLCIYWIQNLLRIKNE